MDTHSFESWKGKKSERDEREFCINTINKEKVDLTVAKNESNREKEKEVEHYTKVPWLQTAF